MDLIAAFIILVGIGLIVILCLDDDNDDDDDLFDNMGFA